MSEQIWTPRPIVYRQSDQVSYTIEAHVDVPKGSRIVNMDEDQEMPNIKVVVDHAKDSGAYETLVFRSQVIQVDSPEDVPGFTSVSVHENDDARTKKGVASIGYGGVKQA